MECFKTNGNQNTVYKYQIEWLLFYLFQLEIDAFVKGKLWDCFIYHI